MADDRLKKAARPLFRMASSAYGRLARFTYPRIVLPPLRISVLVTTRCNLQCPFCPDRGRLNQPEPDRLSLAEWRRIIDTIPRFTVVDFMGAEPFLALDIFDILEYLAEKKHIIWTCSNGTTLDADKIEFLVDRGLTFIRFSIDGMETYHNRIRGGAHAFEKVTETLKRFHLFKKKKGASLPIIGVKTNITDDNYDEIPRLLPFVENELKADQIYFNLLYENSLLNALQLTDDFGHPGFIDGNTYAYPSSNRKAIQDCIRFIYQYRKQSGMVIGFSQEMKERDTLAYIDDPTRFGVKVCHEPWIGFTLYYNGIVSPCIAYEVDNIRNLKYDVNNVLAHPGYRSYLTFFSKHKPFFPPCGGCIAKHERIDR